MRRARPQRHAIIDLHRITIGDYVVLFSALIATVSLFLPWSVSTTGVQHNQWAFTYSELAAIVVIVFFLAVLFLVIYPALSPDLRLPLLPFSTPVIFLTMGAILLLLFSYELGKYACVELCLGFSRGIGVWIGWISALAFIIGAIVRWGSRPTGRQREFSPSDVPLRRR